MKIDDAITVMRLTIDFLDLNSEQEEAFIMAIDALEDKRDNAWHDLRKNPEDLPEVGVPFVYAFTARDDVNNRVTYNSAEGYGTEVEIMKRQANPFALYRGWRYFEPFEEAEDD